MDYKNDERYWNINLLNKWFAISSILFLFSFIWMFYDDNDDEFKIYQKEFRKIESQVSSVKLENALVLAKDKRAQYENKYQEELEVFNSNSSKIDSMNLLLISIQGLQYKANMDYLFQKAEADGLKYLYENEITHSSDSHSLHVKSHYVYEEKYLDAVKIMNSLKLIKEDYESQITKIEFRIKNLSSQLNASQENLNEYLKEVNILTNKLKKLDRSKMSYINQIGDIVRDLPIIDFMDPYYRVNQVVVHDVKYDVNFASVPTVDRCTSCHLGISNADYKDAPQPFTSHPDLDLFVSTSSPHSFDQYGCTSCHSGRGRGTDFVSSVHTPGSPEQEKEWIEKYDWKNLHHWLQPMLPTKYTQASCFKCHQAQPILDGGDKLALGLMLIDKSGCNNCHHIESYKSMRKGGPPLTNINEKVNKDWAMKWINDPQSFRYNTWMPHFFNQDNNSDQASILRNEAEIYAITEYLYLDGDKTSFDNSNQYIGDANSGEKLFNSVGCRGCHVIDENTTDLENISINYDLYTSNHGYEVDSSGNGYEKMDRYTLLKYQGPNLVGLGSKTDAKWLYNWIKNPEEYWPDTKMPNLRLSKEESRDITAYLLSFNNSEFEKIESVKSNAKELESIARQWLVKSFPEVEANDKLNLMSETELVTYVAKKSISYYGCYTCHIIDGFENNKPIGVELTNEGSKPLDKLDFGHIHSIDHTNFAWFEQKLANPRIFDQHKIVANEDKSRMPNFYFKPEEIEAIVTAILGFSNNKVSDNMITYNLVDDKSVFEGYSLINKYNCQGCHIINDFGGQIADVIGALEYSPPNLNTQGSKTNSEWLFNFFNHPITIRPNLQVRMPSFNFTDLQWNAIIKAFQHIDNRNLLLESDFNFDHSSQKYKSGKKLHSFGACNNCHFYGENFPIQGPQTWAPNLALTKERLRPEWVVQWLDNPALIMPGTKMPAPYIPDSLALLLDSALDTWGIDIMKLGGDRQAMLEGLRNYIYSIEGKVDISQIIKDYFKENGYDFNLEEEEEFDDEEW